MYPLSHINSRGNPIKVTLAFPNSQHGAVTHLLILTFCLKVAPNLPPSNHAHVLLHLHRGQAGVVVPVVAKALLPDISITSLLVRVSFWLPLVVKFRSVLTLIVALHAVPEPTSIRA